MSEKIFNYCERGLDPSFWAEPLNAITNGAFIVASLFLFRAILSRPAVRDDLLVHFLALTVAAIGVGSFLFHTFAERWAGAADVIPIMIFMLTAVFATMIRLFRTPIWGGLLMVLGFVGLMYASFQLRPLIGGGTIGQSLGYAPALLMLFVHGAILSWMGRPAGSWLLAAALVFTVSLTTRSIDRGYCEMFTIDGHVVGSHFVWHLLNGVTLYLTTMAFVRHGPRAARRDALSNA